MSITSIPVVVDVVSFGLYMGVMATVVFVPYQLYASASGYSTLRMGGQAHHDKKHAAEDAKRWLWRLLAKANVTYLLPGWALAIIGFLTVVFDVYGVWRIYRVYDTTSNLWLATIGLAISHWAVALIWGAIFFHARAPAWASVVMTVTFASAAAIDVLMWVLPTQGTPGVVGYTYTAASVYLLPVLFSLYALIVNFHLAAASAHTPERIPDEPADRLGAHATLAQQAQLAQRLAARLVQPVSE